MSHLNYDPNNLFDTIKKNLYLQSDTSLCYALGVSPTYISLIRSGKLKIGAKMLIRLHQISGLSIKQLLFLMGDCRKGLYDYISEK